MLNEPLGHLQDPSAKIHPFKVHRGRQISDAVNIPLPQLRDRLDEIPGDRPVLIHCQVGQTSYNACRILMGLGRTGVVNLCGGYAAYAEWKQAGGS